MKLRILPIVALLAATVAAAVPATARLTARDAFFAAPASVMPLLDSMTRMDMVDYFSSGMDRKMTNILQGESNITGMSDDAITVATTGSTTMTIALLPAGKDTILGVITTYALPGGDSKIDFYDRRWKALETKRYFKAPTLDDWLAVKGRAADDVRTLLPFVIADYTYDPASGMLTARSNVREMASIGDFDSIVPSIRPEIKYQWTGKKFKPVDR